jgi:hypothetical protein
MLGLDRREPPAPVRPVPVRDAEEKAESREKIRRFERLADDYYRADQVLRGRISR